MRRTIILMLLILTGSISSFPQGRFYPFGVDQDGLGGAPDFSFLNRTITPAERVFTRGEDFWIVGPDGLPGSSDDTKILFFGVNLAFGGNFPEEKDAVRIARRLRRLGVNIVRLHHLDTDPDEESQRARSILTTGPYPTLNAVAAGRLRRFITALREEGIYINLNLHVGYRFRPEVDGIPPLPEGLQIPTQSKPLHVFHPRMVELQTIYVRRVIEALGLRDDPVLAMVEINNESSLLWSWQRRLLDRYLQGEYRAELRREWNRFLKAKYQTTTALEEAWKADPDSGTGGLGDGQRLEDGTVELVREQERAAKARTDDFLLFLVDRDRAYLNGMLAVVRAVTGGRVPVTGTQMGFTGPLGYDSHRDLDYIDEHFYIDHYNFPNRSWDSRDWRIRDSSSTGSGLRTYLSVAAWRPADRPYTVSEFNQQWPNTKAAELVPTLAAFGAFQGWNGLMHFAYAHGREWNTEVPRGFDLNGDWTKYPAFGQAAWLFRSGAIQRGVNPIDVPFTFDLRLEAGRAGRTGDMPGFMQGKLGLAPHQALIHRVRVVIDGDVELPPEVKAQPVPCCISDTGELTFDPGRKLLLIHADRAAGVFGFPEDWPVTAGALEVTLSKSTRWFASILLTPLDDKPLRESHRMLLTVPGFTLRSRSKGGPLQQLVNYAGQSGWWTLQPDTEVPDRPSGTMSGGEGPVWMERVECFLKLSTTADALGVYPLNGSGKRLAALPAKDVVKAPDGFRIHIQADGQAYAPWYEIVAGP